jgi:hypothetical protein
MFVFFVLWPVANKSELALFTVLFESAAHSLVLWCHWCTDWARTRDLNLSGKTSKSTHCELVCEPTRFSESIVLHFIQHNGGSLLSNNFLSPQSTINSQVSCLDQLGQILSVFFYLECHPDTILQRYLIQNDLQQYLYCPEPTAVLIGLYHWHLNCLEPKGLCSLNTSTVHGNHSSLGDIKRTVVLDQIWKIWSDE